MTHGVVSKPSRRRILFAAAASCLLVLPLRAQGGAGLDSARTVQLLSNARNANPVICELAMHAIESRYGNWGSTGRAPDAIIGQRTLLEWASQDIEDSGAVAVLASALSDEDACVPRLAARLFGRVKHQRAVAILTRSLADGDERTRRMAAIALGHLEDEEAVEPLLDALSDAVGIVRAAAAWALGEIEAEGAIDGLTRLLGEDPDPFVRRQAAWALGNMY